MNKVININLYSQTEIIPRVTKEELENENIMQNGANHNLESKEGIHEFGIWAELVELCEKTNNVIYGCLKTGEVKVTVGQTWCKQTWIDYKCIVMRSS